MSAGSQRVVVAAFLINLLIAAFKFLAAYFSRSTAMLAEAAHSLADTTNQIFLFIGMRRSSRPPDDRHPFGYGMETYFWAFMVALSIFIVGAGFSIREGIHKIIHRDAHELGDVRWAYGVLGVSILLEIYSLLVAMREFKKIRAGRGVRRTLSEARDPIVVTVLFEDIAALFGLAVAAGGVALAHWTGDMLWDGIASILVGVALAAVAFILARDSKSLLIGRGVTPDEEDKIKSVVASHADVLALIHLRTMHLGPQEVILALKIRFRSELSTGELEHRINELEARLREAVPILRRIYVEPGFDESTGRKEKVTA